MKIVHLVAPALTFALLGGVTAQEEASHKKAHPELTKALSCATVHNKRVLTLLVADGEDVAAAWKKDRKLSRTLSYEFEIVQLAGKAADAFATEHEFPAAIQMKPAVIVLDTKGKVLARLPASELAAEGEAFLAKLEPHFCEPADADKKLAAALVDAKKTGRNVFIRFDAPW